MEDYIAQMKELIKAEIKKAYLEGASQGGLTAVVTVWRLLEICAIPDPHPLRDCIKEFAKEQLHCDDIEIAALEMHQITEQ